ncbi:hypothetical protein PMAC_001283 [Pneumocystis sp. 'macacae']|nr:hypothetical protein PMAC_001283 [Pneumocystis sp. 'macacae']
MLRSIAPRSPTPLLWRIVRTAVPLLTDCARDVRAALRSLLVAVFSGRTDLIEAHTVFLVLHIHSGLTHVLDDVRCDSAGLLEWLLSEAGDALVRHGWARFLETFSVLLGWSRPARTVFACGRSRLPHLRALRALLVHGLSFGTEQRRPPPVLTPREAAALAGIGHPRARMYMGHPGRSAPYGHLGLFSQTKHAGREEYGDAESRLQVFGRHVEGLLGCLQETWAGEQLSRDSAAQDALDTCRQVVLILGAVERVVDRDTVPQGARARVQELRARVGGLD